MFSQSSKICGFYVTGSQKRRIYISVGVFIGLVILVGLITVTIGFFAPPPHNTVGAQIAGSLLFIFGIIFGCIAGCLHCHQEPEFQSF
jgi:hypothetical protein